MSTRAISFLVLSALIIVYLFIGYLYVHVGLLGLDEGWYLYASKKVWEGRVLYRDFAHTQPPLLPYIYGLPQLLSENRLYAGRIESLVFGGSAILLAMLSAMKLRGRSAAIVCGLCVILNPFTVYHFAIAKTYALTAFLLAAAIYLLIAKQHKWWNYSVAAFFLSLAAGVRLSLIVTLPVLCLLAVVFEWRNKRSFITGAVVSIITLGAIYLPFWSADRDNLWFNLVSFHVASFQHLSTFSVIYEKLDRLGTLMSNIWLFFVLGLGASATFFLSRRGSLREEIVRHKSYLLIGVITSSVFIAHLVPRAMQADYHVVIVPSLGILAGCVFARWYSLTGDRKSRTLLVVMLGGALFASALGGNHFLDLRGRQGPIDQVHQIASEINQSGNPSDEIFTFQGYIAVEAGRDLLPGLEMSVFSYYPDWDDSLCHRRKVVNSDMVMEILENRRPAVVILTDRDFSMESVLNPLPLERRQQIAAKLKEILQHRY